MQTRKAEHHGLPGRLFFLRGESVGQARHRQQRIRLLDDLVPLQAVETDLMVAGGVPLFERGGVHRLQQLEAIVGAQVASHWVPRDLDALFQRLPSRQFLLAEAERRKAVGGLPLHPPGGRQRQVKVMADHHIGEKVVAGDPAVFIRSLAEQQVETCAVRRRRIATAPETGRLDVDFLRLPGKRGISCDARVQVQRIDHIRRDMHLTGADVPAFTLFAAIVGGHPRIAGPGAVHAAGMLPGLGQAVDTVLHQAAGRRRGPVCGAPTLPGPPAARPPGCGARPAWADG